MLRVWLLQYSIFSTILMRKVPNTLLFYTPALPDRHILKRFSKIWMVFRFSHHRGSSEFFVELQSDCDREKIAGGLSSLDSTFKIPHYEDISAMLAEKISRSKIQIFSPLSLLIFKADFIAVILLLKKFLSSDHLV